MGAVLREQNALPYKTRFMKNLTAKDDVDNVGAGRTAKGANPKGLEKSPNYRGDDERKKAFFHK